MRRSRTPLVCKRDLSSLAVAAQLAMKAKLATCAPYRLRRSRARDNLLATISASAEQDRSGCKHFTEETPAAASKLTRRATNIGNSYLPLRGRKTMTQLCNRGKWWKSCVPQLAAAPRAFISDRAGCAHFAGGQRKRLRKQPPLTGHSIALHAQLFVCLMRAVNADKALGKRRV